jgi:putative nucleotidyltransferase with HDIG domain
VYTLRDVLCQDATSVYLVGGVVRDAFWGLPVHDVDLVVPDGGFRVARRIADALDGKFYKLDPERETGRAIFWREGKRWVVDVANFRGGNLLADLRGRDFTLNAVAVPLAGSLDGVIDPLNGLLDAQNRILRRCSPTSLADDPIRALRAVRLSTRFRLRIEPATLSDLRQEGPRLTAASAERVRDEFMALLDGSRPAAGLRVLDSLGLLALIVPEVNAMRGVRQSLPHRSDVWEHTLATVERLAAVLHIISPQRTEDSAAQAGLGLIVYALDRFRPQLQAHLAQAWPDERPHVALLTLAALLHDSGKPATQEVDGERIRFLGHDVAGAVLAEERGWALRLSRGEIIRLRGIVRHHLRPLLLDGELTLSRRAVYRFWRDCGPAGIDVCLLALADYLATAGPALETAAWSHLLQTVGTLLEAAYRADVPALANLPALVTGDDLMRALEIPPGPQIGSLLEQLREAQAAGEIHTAAEALALARRLLE